MRTSAKTKLGITERTSNKQTPQTHTLSNRHAQRISKPNNQRRQRKITQEYQPQPHYTKAPSSPSPSPFLSSNSPTFLRATFSNTSFNFNLHTASI